MAKYIGEQLSLIAESEFTYQPVGDWDYDELGTNKFPVPNFSNSELGTKEISVPNSSPPKLGTKEISVPNFPNSELGTKEISVPNFYEPPRQIPRWDDPIDSNWKPPIGCLDRKWSKNHQYWCWRYYDNDGKKRSIHLHKDYNKAVRKCLKIGVPTDAKLSNLSATDPQAKAQNPTTDNLVDIAPTAHRASRNRRAA